MKRATTLTAICCLTSLLATSALAQDGKIQVSPLKIIGKIVSIDASTMVVQADSGQKWNALLTNNFGQVAKVSIKGVASEESLKDGIYISFTANLDIRGNIQDPITEVSIFTPGDVKKPGLFENDIVSGEEGGRRITNYLVNAMIKSRSGKKVALAVPGKVLHGTLGDTVSVKMESEDLKLAKPGQRVVVEGFYQPNGTAVPAGSMVPQNIQVLLDGAKADEELAQGDNPAQPNPAQPNPAPNQPAPNGPSDGPAQPKPGDGVGKIVEIN